MNVRQKWQMTGFTCGAAAVAMILDIPESEARKLAGTSRSGTTLDGAAKALRGPGRSVHVVTLDNLPLSEIGWALEEQSKRWPLYLSLRFPNRHQRSDGRKFWKDRRHACVLWQGQLYDPGEWETLSVDTLGHLADAEVKVHAYLIVEEHSGS